MADLGPFGGVDDPAGADEWDGLDADDNDQDHKIIGPGVGRAAGPRPLKWFPSDPAMAAIGVATVMAIVFMVWRFG